VPLRIAARTSAPWLPLGPTGALQLTDADVLACARPRPPLCDPAPPRASRNSPQLRDMLADLLANDHVWRVPTHGDAPGTLHIVPKNATKCRSINDLSRANRASGLAPRTFRLPRLADLKTRFRSACPWFATMDLANFFWSLRLPPSLCRSFTFEVSGRIYAFKCLPFGWSFSPALAQRVSERLADVVRLLADAYVWLDDILLAAADPGDLATACDLIARRAADMGLLVHPSKSRLHPDATADWVGKRFQQAPTDAQSGIAISAPPDTHARAIASVFAALVLARSPRAKAATTGLLAWHTCHTRLALPFLRQAHRELFSGQRFSPAAARDLALASLLAGQPYSGQGYDTAHPAPPTPVVVCDASFSRAQPAAGRDRRPARSRAPWNIPWMAPLWPPGRQPRRHRHP